MSAAGALPPAEAEPLVVLVASDRRVLAARWASRVTAVAELAEGEPERGVDEQAAPERLALAEEQLQRLGRLQDADEARQDAEAPRLGAGGREVRRGWRREQAPVAGPVEGNERVAAPPGHRKGAMSASELRLRSASTKTSPSRATRAASPITRATIPGGK